MAIEAINKIFQEGEFTATDFAIIAEMCTKHDDGVLDGCEISGSGNTLTCTSGHCMVHGRLIEILGGSITVESQSTSTNMVLILEVDLSKDNSTRLFVDTTGNYPDDEDFNIVQGKAYMWLAKFTVGSSGITSTTTKILMPKLRQLGTVNTIALSTAKQLSKADTEYALITTQLPPGNYLITAYAHISGVSGGSGTTTISIVSGDLSRATAVQHSVNKTVTAEVTLLLNISATNSRDYTQEVKLKCKSSSSGRKVTSAQLRYTRLG